MRFDATTADCRVHTFKEGLLSAVAHDLEIAVTAFTIDVAADRWHLDARFDATSLRVVGARRGGAVDPSVLSDDNKRTIEGNIVRDVLDAGRHPEIRFVSDVADAGGDTLTLRGTLTLCGRARPLLVPARRGAGGWTAEARLHQPDFGIRPYRAMMGTLRVQADVIVRLSIPSGS